MKTETETETDTEEKGTKATTKTEEQSNNKNRGNRKQRKGQERRFSKGERVYAVAVKPFSYAHFGCKGNLEGEERESMQSTSKQPTHKFPPKGERKIAERYR